MKDNGTTEQAVQDAEVLSVEPDKPPARPARMLGFLALLLALAASGASYWLWTQTGELRDRVRELSASRTASMVQPDRDGTGLAEQALGELQALRGRLQQIETELESIRGENAVLQQGIAALSSVSAPRADRWRLAEAEYLERLANQSLLMGREVRGAIALLRSADSILGDLDDPSLHGARTALAEDIAKLRAVAAFDVEGTYLRLAALSAQIPALVGSHKSFDAPAVRESLLPADEQRSAAHWWQRLLAQLDRYVVVRRRAEPVKPLLPPGEELQLRMNLRLALEQAKLALLAAEPAVYRGALADADSWIRDYFDRDTAGNRAFLDELAELALLDIAPRLPDISASLRALRETAGGSRSLDQSAATVDTKREP